MKKQYSAPQTEHYSIDVNQEILSTSDVRIDVGGDDDRTPNYDVNEDRGWDAWD